MLAERQYSIDRANLAVAWAHMLQAAAGELSEEIALHEWNEAMHAFGTPLNALRIANLHLAVRQQRSTSVLCAEEDFGSFLRSLNLPTHCVGGIQ